MTDPTTTPPAPKKGSKLKWLILGGVLLLGGCCGVPAVMFGLLGVGMKAQQDKEAKQIATGPDMTVTADEVYQAYKDNEIAADQKYKGKVLEMTGTVDGVKPDHIELKAGRVVAQVNVYFSDSEKPKAASLTKGQTVTVRGKCGGKGIGYPYLEHAILVSP